MAASSTPIHANTATQILTYLIFAIIIDRARHLGSTSLAGCGKTLLPRENFDDPHMWHNGRKTLGQDAQKGRSARPQRAKRRGVQLRYVELLSEARTKLADFFSILLEQGIDERRNRRSLSQDDQASEEYEH